MLVGKIREFIKNAGAYGMNFIKFRLFFLRRSLLPSIFHAHARKLLTAISILLV
jgi:hypothetical protein